MCLRLMFWLFLLVALRKESVDRNVLLVWPPLTALVALRKESVDRNNLHCVEEVSGDTVALRKESVDRNVGLSALAPEENTSLSARRAWIEIHTILGGYYNVASSLSARRAWIEIMIHHTKKEINPVALRKESVDRNMNYYEINEDTARRSPQGERG